VNHFTCKRCDKQWVGNNPWWRITAPWPRCCGTDMKWNLFIRFDDKRDEELGE
jgi:hypothetical protein